MFWRFNYMTSDIDTLLDKEDVTLQEILSEDDVLQECKAQNKKLVDFLIRPDNIQELVNLVINEPAADVDERARYKYANIACELLTSDVNVITETLATTESLLNKIISYLDTESPLNPLQASFFSKVMGLLITRKSELILERLKTQTNFISQVLRHLGTSAIMDLLLRLITSMESQDAKNSCVNWLSEEKIVEKLIQNLDPANDCEVHNNAAQTLCDIIRLSREPVSQLQEPVEPSALLTTIELQETVGQLLDTIFKGDVHVESCLINGLYIIQTLLEFRRLGPEGLPEPMSALELEGFPVASSSSSAVNVASMISAIVPRLKNFHQILLDPPKQYYQPMLTTCGLLEHPLGNTRLQTVRLIATLLMANSAEVNSEMARLGTIEVLLDLYFEFTWNNFLHAQVERSILIIVTSELPGYQSLLTQLIAETRLLEKIMDAFSVADQPPIVTPFLLEAGVSRRRGFMGHLTRIANSLVGNHVKNSNTEKLEHLVESLAEETRLRWGRFVAGELADVNKRNFTELMGGGSGMPSVNDDDDDFRSISFPQESASQKPGFYEDDYNEQDDVRLSFADQPESRFSVSPVACDNASAEEMFERMCSAREQGMPNFDPGDAVNDDLWEEKECTRVTPVSDNIPRQRSAASSSTRDQLMLLGEGEAEDDEGTEDGGGAKNSSDSEEDLESPATIHQAPEHEGGSGGGTNRTAGSTAAGSEAMDVSSSEDWAKFDEVPMDIVHPSTDTSSSTWWGGSSTRPNISAVPVSEDTTTTTNWAEFGNSSAASTSSLPTSFSSSGTEGWANFSEISSEPGLKQSGEFMASNCDSTASPHNKRSSAYVVAADGSMQGSASLNNAAESGAAAPNVSRNESTPQEAAAGASPQTTLDTETGTSTQQADTQKCSVRSTSNSIENGPA